MARDDEVNSNYNSFSDYDDIDNESVHNDYDELYGMFEELYSKFEELSKMHTNFKKENSIIFSKCEILQKENMNFKNEINALKKGKEKDISNTLALENES